MSQVKPKKNALGRGLSAILESPETDITSKDISGEFVVGAVAAIEIAKIETNPFQPRNEFEELALKELSDSIKQQGIIQPVTVRKLGYDKYQLISGERRLRASILAGLTEIPAYIRVADDQQMLEMALIENIHREDLNAIEIGISYQRLMDECSLSVNEMSERIGQNRSTIANYIRLLKLPPEIQVAIRDKQITMGHARALITVESPEMQLGLLRDTIEQDLSVRDVENRVKELNQPVVKVHKQPVDKQPLPERFVDARNKISERTGTKIEIKRNPRGKGAITINFRSDEEFNRIVSLFQ
ncbi:MAG: ParB/RepB/Spo0J family partition protein [Bacteroidales bacterium]|jgi:ParB family chromosome partitioning protein|nr:ParB/RepB/Spo0J family partition protein [Bacteroidales bacterium]MDD3665911.1 ParB/RepB/Spo0J family partition protein [Bacteroidales bacterium]